MAMEDSVLRNMKEIRSDGYILKPFTDVARKVSIKLAINKNEPKSSRIRTYLDKKTNVSWFRIAGW